MDIVLGERELLDLVNAGYVVLRNRVGAELVSAAKRAINISLGQGIDPAALSRLRVTSFCPELRADPALMNLLERSGLWRLGEILLGTGQTMTGSQGNAQINLRFPVERGTLLPIEPHLDGVASRTNKVPAGTLQSFSMLIGVMMSDMLEPQCGNFTVWPGSHLLNARALKRDGPRSLLDHMPNVTLGAPLQITGRSGDVVLCHYLVSHGTAPNWSSDIRYMVFFRLVRQNHPQEIWDSLTDPWMQWPGVPTGILDAASRAEADRERDRRSAERPLARTQQASAPFRRSASHGPVCGLKLTHDGAVAVVEDGRLIFSTEMEKINGSPRHCAIGKSDRIINALEGFGYSSQDVRTFVIDGWGLANTGAASDKPAGERSAIVTLEDEGTVHTLAVSRYREASADDDITRLRGFSGLPLHGRSFNYLSSYHVTGHILAAYSTSSFAMDGADCHVLAWDGGIYPSLYLVKAADRRIDCLGPLFRMFGDAYSDFAGRFAPFFHKKRDELSIAGKVMAYIALGRTRPEIMQLLKGAGRLLNDGDRPYATRLADYLKESPQCAGFSDEDFMRSFHDYVEGLLCATLEMRFRQQPRSARGLCITGGCGLNIKWNSAIRSMGLFSSVYVPPFPNDSGSAIGAAVAHSFANHGPIALGWSVYSGPALIDGSSADWDPTACSIEELAALLHTSNEPVVVLQGRAELGPRALGNRSIVASPVSAGMKSVLNGIKNREHYRPVAPMCLESDAREIFDPGFPDPYMLFEHRVRPAWKDRLPAVMHLDGTARLQTVSSESNPAVAALLTAFRARSGIPVLCNTSANCAGAGFFPDVRSACNWGKTNYVWSEGVLYTSPRRVSYDLTS